MDDLPFFHANSLSASQFHRLSQCAGEAEAIPVPELLLAARRHLERTHLAYAGNRLINVRLAAAIVAVLEELSDSCNSLKVNEVWWLKGAMHYFAVSNDDEPDFQSPLGFEDDGEILNACLKYIGRNDLCLNAEDYDNA